MNNEVKMIPINQIRILNPRPRDRKKFEQIVQSIQNLGLKKPIQVSQRSAEEGDEPGYDLVCGQGRMEAFMALGHNEIPAIVVEVPREERLLRSLVENMARRLPPPLALMNEIEPQPSHRNSKKRVGSLTRTCHTAGHEKAQTSNRIETHRFASALQLHSAALGAAGSSRHGRG